MTGPDGLPGGFYGPDGPGPDGPGPGSSGPRGSVDGGSAADSAFATWPRVLTGALVAALLAGCMQVLAEVVLTGRPAVGRGTVGLAGVAFWGYLLVSVWIRRNPERDAT